MVDQSLITSEREFEREFTEEPLEQVPIIWAIDAFPDKTELHIRTAAALKALYPDSRIQPVYVLSEESFTDRGFSTFLKPALRPMAFKAVKSILNEIPGMNLCDPRVLVESAASRPACARKLLHFASKTGAGLIALGTHGRRGFSRFFIGSFSEALLDHSHLPILITGPASDIEYHRPREIVFPTDFSPACQDAFGQILAMAKNFGSELHLFHKALPTFGVMADPFAQAGMGVFGGGWMPTEVDYSEPPSDHDIIEEWRARAEAAGVKTVTVSRDFAEPTAEAIVQYLKDLGHESPALVTMVPQTGPVASAFLGSVTRDVVNSSPAPVYIMPRQE